jgi:arylsulfatase A-like enzyme
MAATLGDALAGVAPYPTAGIAALAIVCGLELALAKGHVGAAYVGYLACLVTPLGFAQGWIWQASLALLARMPRRAAWLFVSAVALGAGLWFADSLGSFVRLGSRYDRLARLTLVTCVLGAAGSAGLVLALRPRSGAPLGWLGGLRVLPRLAVALTLAASAGACAYADATLYVGLYLQAHVALRMATTSLLMLAVALAAGRRLPRLRARGALAVAVLLLVPLLGLRESDPDAIQGFVTRPWSATVLRTARGTLDLDRDGFSALLGGGDCDDLDATVNPAAREVPDNGIDDNCAFGDGRRKVVAPSAVPVPTEASPVSVVLITVDTLRHDRVGLGNSQFGPQGRNTMPNVHRWGRNAVNFRRAYTAGGWTSIALSTLLRGMYARRLEWIAYFETNFYRLVRNPVVSSFGGGERIAKMFPLAWNDPHEPLPFWLKRRGMHTMAVVDDGFSQMLAGQLGANRGFDSYREVNGEPPDDPDGFRRAKRRNRGVNLGQSDASTASAAVAALAAMKGTNARFFLWTHFFGPHTPSTRHPGLPYDASSNETQYDHEVRYVDSQIARVLEAIDQLDTPTAVFLTADHGERFFKRYRSHGADLSEEVLRVPLLARVPGWPPKHVDQAVSLVDLMPTILAITGTPAPSDLDGIDLAAVLTRQAAKSRILLTDTWQYAKDGTNFSDFVGAFDGRRKAVLDRRDHSIVTYDQRDPAAKPVRVEGLAVDRLVRATMGYIEESGGTLAIER